MKVQRKKESYERNKDRYSCNGKDVQICLSLSIIDFYQDILSQAGYVEQSRYV